MKFLPRPVIKKSKIKKIPWILGKYAFWVILVFISLDIILGGFLFYKYVILAEKEKPKIITNLLRFEREIYQEVLEKLQTREKKFEESLEEEYSNPFQEKIEK
jgi:hypothetical protein